MTEYIGNRIIGSTSTAHKIRNLEDAYQMLKPYANAGQEQMILLTLDGAHQVIGLHVVTIGLVNSSQVHPREIFRPAIADNAVSIITAHNHPSGSLDASRQDIEVTGRLKKAAEIIGITLLDSVIFTKTGAASIIDAF